MNKTAFGNGVVFANGVYICRLSVDSLKIIEKISSGRYFIFYTLFNFNRHEVVIAGRFTVRTKREMEIIQAGNEEISRKLRSP